MVQNVRYLNGLPSHVTITFKYQTFILKGFQVLGIHMATVSQILKLLTLELLIDNIFLSIC